MVYLFSIIITVLLIFLFSYFAPKFKLIDFPSERKLHTFPTPLVGGLSIYVTVLLIFPFIYTDISILIIILSSGIMLILGLLDDALDLGVITKLVSQLIATLLIIGSGLHIEDIGDYSFLEEIELGMFGVLLTVISVMSLTNAINFIDGIDGLCSGLISIGLLSLYFFIILSGNSINTEIIFILFFSNLTFLLINLGFLPIKKVFLGDAGSIFLGFIFSWLLIYYSHPSMRSIHPVLTIWCVSVPIYDLLGVIVRRVFKNNNPFKADRRHIHHILIDMGFSQFIALFIIISLSIFFSIIGGLIYFIFGPAPSLLCFFIFLFLYVCITFYISTYKSIRNI